MSLAVRQSLVASPLTRFSSSVTDPDNIRNDLLDPNQTSTNLIALLVEIILVHNIPFEFTVARTGHHDDGPHGHAGGFAVDGWPLNTPSEGAFADANSNVMKNFLSIASRAQFLRQIGLAGTAFTPTNMGLAGPTAFHDDGADHIHLGAVIE